MTAFVSLPGALASRRARAPLRPRVCLRAYDAAPAPASVPAPAPASAAPATPAAFAVSRRALLSGMALAAVSAALPPAARADEFSTESGLKVNVVKKGTGPKINVGDLVAIRFKGSYNGVVFDDIFQTDQPYFYRCGSELVLKGIAEAVSLMSVGDMYELTIPGELAFGKKGRRASAGKPSIPPNAVVNYTLLAESIPGRGAELLEVLDDEGEE